MFGGHRAPQSFSRNSKLNRPRPLPPLFVCHRKCRRPVYLRSLLPHRNAPLVSALGFFTRHGGLGRQALKSIPAGDGGGYADVSILSNLDQRGKRRLELTSPLFIIS